MDEKTFELAEQLEQRQRDDAIARAARGAQQQFDADFDGTHCVLCGDEIPEARLKLGKARCITCQTHWEKQRAHKT